MSAWSLIMTSSQWIHQTFSGVCQHDTWHGPVIHTRDIISSLPPITGLISRLSPVFLFWNVTQNKCYILSKFREFLSGRRRQSLIRQKHIGRPSQASQARRARRLNNELLPTDTGAWRWWWHLAIRDKPSHSLHSTVRQAQPRRSSWLDIAPHFRF